MLPASLSARLARFRAAVPRRAAGVAAALAAELLLVLLLLTLAPGVPEPRRERRTTFSISDEPAVPEQEKTPEADEPAVAQTERPVEAPVPPAPPVPAPIAPPVPVPIVPLSPAQMAQADITPPAPPAPAVPRRGVAGPPNVGGGSAFADTPRVSGSGPNGEPLYAAAWYREPYPEELRGYLSTAQGPGWALIACRTVREWRVEDCVKLDESPAGSNIARSVLAAAWQFKVRPPRLGGELRYGEWVRIRIDYGVR